MTPRQIAGVAVAGLLAGLLLATVTTAGGVGMWQAPDFDPQPTGPPTAPEASETTAEELPESELDESEFELPGWLDAILRVALVAAMLVAGMLGLQQAWQRRPRLRFRRRSWGEADFDVLPDVGAAVVDDAEAQRAALLDGVPRNAIVRCWQLLEDAVADAGLRRDPADTSSELTERVLADYAVDPTAIHELAALYREARFSQHPIDEPMRATALQALDRLHEALRAGRAPTAVDGVR